MHEPVWKERNFPLTEKSVLPPLLLISFWTFVLPRFNCSFMHFIGKISFIKITQSCFWQFVKGFTRLIFDICHIMRGLYYAFIYPYLSYVNIVWGSKYTTRLAPIRRLQKKIIRIITFSKFKEHTGPLFKELSILPLHDINNEAILLCLCFDTTITIYHHLSVICFVWTKTFINTTQVHPLFPADREVCSSTALVDILLDVCLTTL